MIQPIDRSVLIIHQLSAKRKCNERLDETNCLDYLNAAGFNQHQYMIFRHHAADHPHLHIFWSFVLVLMELLSATATTIREVKKF